MTYGEGISFPVYPTKKDIKELRKQVAHDRFEVVDGGQAKDEPAADRAGDDKSKPGGEED